MAGRSWRRMVPGTVWLTAALVGIVYARHGGVTMLLFVDVLSPSDFDDDDVENLVDVALDKMTRLGRVEVSG